MSAIQPLFPLINPMPKATADAPIGIFDSGIGGLSIAQEIAKHLPHERFIYFADTAHVPYGPRDDQNIRELTAQAIEWLYRKGCKVAVVACNTASAFSLDYLREHYGDNFPIIGLVPALKPAVLQSKSKTVAVLATPATFRGQLIKDVVEKFAQPDVVIVDEDHPIFMRAFQGELRPYVHVRFGINALIQRAAFFHLVEMGELSDDAEGQVKLCLQSGDLLLQLGT